MKQLLFISFSLISVNLFAQKQTFDLTTFTAPKAWKKQTTQSAVQFSKEDAAKGGYCIIMLLKSVPGTKDAKANFDAAWETVVKETVTVSAPPEMQPPAIEKGWEAQSGYAPFENDGNKGMALLVTSTGFEKMVNILILTNTDVYEKEVGAFLESISFKKITPAPEKPKTNPAEPAQPSVAKKDGYTFTTTNFDDGWVSVAMEDWVEVTKGNIKVMIHYPNKITNEYIPDGNKALLIAWDNLVAPRYSNLKNFKTTYINAYDYPHLAMGSAVENAGGKEVYIVLFRQGKTGWLEFVTPDKNSFIQTFKFDPETIQSNSESNLLKPIAQMASYNKFAVAAADFKGTWTNEFAGLHDLYNVYTGNYAKTTINQAKETFTFSGNGSYSWHLIVVSGYVGNAKFDQAKSTGKMTVLNNWQVGFSDIQGKPRKYRAFFSCIKGARLLHLLDADYPGSGMYNTYGLKK